MWPFNSSISITKPVQLKKYNQNINDIQQSKAFQQLQNKNSFDDFIQNQFNNSIDILLNSLQNNKKQLISLSFSQEQKNKLKYHCSKPIVVQEVNSQQQNQKYKIQENKKKSDQIDKSNESILLNFLKKKNIDLKYVRSLIRKQQQNEIKSCRRLKVERYLQKRRIKTWNKKICYNCRQKVAEQRLRIKGKFIKKRKAMQILGINKPIQILVLKNKLQQYIQGKKQNQLANIMKKLVQ